MAMITTTNVPPTPPPIPAAVKDDICGESPCLTKK